MEKQNIVKHVTTIVEQACKKETNVAGYEAWTHHIVYVVKFAKQLAEKLGADSEVVELAALLHDYAGITNYDLQEEHHIHGARLAEEILKQVDYPQEKIELVKKCIYNHRGSVVLEKTTPEENCVASGDAMAHIDQALHVLVWACKTKKLGIEGGKAWFAPKLERSWNKLCPEGKEMVREKYECMKKLMS